MVDKDEKEESTIKFVKIDGVTHIIDLDKAGSVKDYLNRVMDDPLIDAMGD